MCDILISHLSMIYIVNVRKNYCIEKAGNKYRATTRFSIFLLLNNENASYNLGFR